MEHGTEKTMIYPEHNLLIAVFEQCKKDARSAKPVEFACAVEFLRSGYADDLFGLFGTDRTADDYLDTLTELRQQRKGDMRNIEMILSGANDQPIDTHAVYCECGQN